MLVDAAYERRSLAVSSNLHQFPKAVANITDDLDVLLTFYDDPDPSRDIPRSDSDQA
jgi:hypothetical protein